MIYIASWFLSLWNSALVGRFSSAGRVFGILLLVSLSLVATVRGRVGTDTVTVYESFANSMAIDGPWNPGSTIEPGFRYLLFYLSSVLDSPALGVRAIAVLFGLALVCFAARATRNELLLLFALYVPAFFYLHGMNTIRLGLAFALLLLALQERRCVRNRRAICLLVLAISVHYSVVLILTMYFVATWSQLATFRHAVYSVGALAVAGAFVLVNPDYAVVKLDLYSDYASPSILSGTRYVAMLILTTLAAALSPVSRPTKLRLLWVTFLLTAASLVLTTLSYAGLRMLHLVALTIPFLLVVLHDKEALRVGWRSQALLITGGVVGASAAYLDFVQQAAIGTSASPFLPYHTLFQ